MKNRGQGDTDWIVAMHPKYQRPFYYNKRTKVSTWEKPKSLAGIETSLMHSTESKSDGSGSCSEEDTQMRMGHEQPPPKPATVNGEWEQHEHKHFKRVYYHNRRERRSTWTPPELQRMLQDMADTVANAGGAEMGHKSTQEEQLSMFPVMEKHEVAHMDFGKPKKESLIVSERLATGQFVRVTGLKGPLALFNDMQGIVRKVRKGQATVEVASKELVFDAMYLKPLEQQQNTQAPSTPPPPPKFEPKDQLVASFKANLNSQIINGAGSALRKSPPASQEQSARPQSAAISPSLLQSIKLRPKSEQFTSDRSPAPAAKKEPTFLDALRSNVLFRTSQSKLMELDQQHSSEEETHVQNNDSDSDDEFI